MKRSLVTILILILISGCSGSHEPVSSEGHQVAQQTEEILSAAAFNQIKEHILAKGDRQTYCNMFNNNPHVDLGNMDIYLNPDTGQENINCDLNLSGFNHMVIRTRAPMRYFRCALNLKATGPDLIVQKDTDSEELKKHFQEALAEINR